MHTNWKGRNKIAHTCGHKMCTQNVSCIENPGGSPKTKTKTKHKPPITTKRF